MDALNFKAYLLNNCLFYDLCEIRSYLAIDYVAVSMYIFKFQISLSVVTMSIKLQNISYSTRDIFVKGFCKCSDVSVNNRI